MVAVVCRHCCGEVCSVIWEAGGVLAVAGAEADSAVEDLVAVVVLEEVSVAVVISVEEGRAGVGRLPISDCRLPICAMDQLQSAIGNWQLAII